MGRHKRKAKKKAKKPRQKKNYGRYPPKRRISADQVPVQNMQTYRTVDWIGAKSVHIKKQKGDFDKRFATLQVTIIAENPQTVGVMIVFKGVPSKEDARIPVSGLLKKELHLYDDRVTVVWDPKAWMNEGQCQVWYELLDKGTDKTGDRMLQIDGYKTLVTKPWRKTFKGDRIFLVLSPADCTDGSTSVVDEHVGQEFKKKIFAKIQDTRDNNEELSEKLKMKGFQHCVFNSPSGQLMPGLN